MSENGRKPPTLFTRAPQHHRSVCLQAGNVYSTKYVMRRRPKGGGLQVRCICLTLTMLWATSQENLWNNFLQCRHNLMSQADSWAIGNAFKKLKHSSVITGCWASHRSVHMLFQQRHTSVDIPTLDVLVDWVEVIIPPAQYRLSEMPMLWVWVGC